MIGYVVMRVAVVAQWLRASRTAGPLRSVALRYAGGIAAVQVLWILFLLVPSGPVQLAAFIVFALIEIAVPVVAERRHQTPWHPHHITERYGLFTLIVLGESLLASANAIIDAVDEVEALGPLLAISALAFVVTAACGGSTSGRPTTGPSPPSAVPCATATPTTSCSRRLPPSPPASRWSWTC